MISRAKHVSIDEFEQMIARGDFEKTRERVDLIRGELRFMSPAGPDHEDVLTYLEDWSVRWAEAHGYLKRSEKSIRFSTNQSIPEPDIAWVRRRRYRRSRPNASDVGLIIEVAYSSLRDDRTEMAALYAEAGIGEYWIVNCIDEQIEVHRDPQAGIYRERFIVKPGEKVSPLVAPTAELDVAELFRDE